MKLSFSIYRYNATTDWAEKFDTFAVPYNKGMTPLDVIMYVQKNLDPTLAYRYECRQGICGTCGLMLNGKPVLSCSTQIDPSIKKQTIQPLAHFQVEKDLIVNLEPTLQKFATIHPYLDSIKKAVITRKKANESKPFRKCIECGCCIAASSTLDKNNGDIIDPMALVKLARYVTDPRDGLNRKKIAKEQGIDAYTEKEGKKLAEVCPRDIPIDEAIRILKKFK